MKKSYELNSDEVITILSSEKVSSSRAKLVKIVTLPSVLVSNEKVDPMLTNEDRTFDLMIGKPNAIEDFLQEVEDLDEEVRAEQQLARQRCGNFQIRDVVWFKEDDGEWLLATISSQHNGAYQLIDAWGNDLVDRDFFHEDLRATGITWNDVWRFFL